MKILVVSDHVLDRVYCSNVKEHYPDVDLIIGCGDLPFYYLDFLVSAYNKPLVYVLGNHDTGPQYTAEGRVLTDVRGGVNLHGRAVNVNGLLLAGLEGSMRYRPNAPLMYTETEMRLQAASIVPGLLRNYVRYGRFLDILVTHSPPFGIHDRPDLAHTGFKFFHTLMHLFKPRYLLHGHIHLYRSNPVRVSQFEETTIINVYPVYTLSFPF